MLPVAILSLVALVSASPVDLYTDALNKRESARYLGKIQSQLTAT